jgi:hypothetical protein
LVLLFEAGCSTIRVTNPPRTATEQFLMSAAATKAISQLAVDTLRDRTVFVETKYLAATTQPTDDQAFFIGELRAKLLLGGVRLVDDRQKAQIILEVRSGGLGIDELDFLLGIPSLYATGNTTPSNSLGELPLATPEIAIVKSIRQKGYAQVAIVAYWNNTGEIVGSSGPFIGRTIREDFWFFGTGPRTVGDIPPAEK